MAQQKSEPLVRNVTELFIENEKMMRTVTDSIFDSGNAVKIVPERLPSIRSDLSSHSSSWSET